ncbi:MAG: hypothetical protein M3164_05575 [Actinomycetota bacterium]|nr:hypothetical protein [Actinomycetota bacterium]
MSLEVTTGVPRTASAIEDAKGATLSSGTSPKNLRVMCQLSGDVHRACGS